MLVFAALAAFRASEPPYAYLIDCSGCNSPFETRVIGRWEARDGRARRLNMTIAANKGPTAPVLGMEIHAEDGGWRFEVSPDGKQFILYGTKTSPVRSVEFGGTGWRPVVTRIPAPPYDLPPTVAPPPREKK